MKQLCYLAPSSEEHRFDDLFNELDIVPTYYAAEQIRSLTAFVTREKTINQQDYIAFDLTGSDWSQEHILSAVQLLRRFAIGRLIFIAPSTDTTALLFGRLAAQRVDDLIAASPESDLQEEMRKCLTRRDEESYHQRLYAMRNAMATSAAQTVSPLKIPKGMQMAVRVGGAMARIGTTTQVFGLYHYLKSVGFAPCIFDPERRLIEALLPFYSDHVQQHEDYMTIQDISFCTTCADRFDAYVQDIGVINELTREIFCTSDLRVLVGGTKPWELPALAAAVAGVKDGPGEMVTLISFAADGDMETVGKYLGPHAASVPYTPNIWQTDNQSAYQEVVLPCLKAICAGGKK